jgi:hypothetical protein
VPQPRAGWLPLAAAAAQPQAAAAAQPQAAGCERLVSGCAAAQRRCLRLAGTLRAGRRTWRSLIRWRGSEALLQQSEGDHETPKYDHLRGAMIIFGRIDPLHLDG